MKNQNWKCIKGCGACCRIEPLERHEALKVLSETQLAKYLDMVGEDGWCRHYNLSTKSCSIYSERPDFCRVSNLSILFDIPEDSAEAFAIKCCRDQINSVYGGRSVIKKQFEKALRSSKPK
ncbi:YkgJ family cysteine cluster protein [Prochlorococcus sp. MIT 1300]|uniref:YkgJ family cysteine cluster protein n=1 Tax=Prochlorococcus sp. MIT 1300 TaxID=3096218 RepID=UPI002A759A71|nr:YkgJ family cysteine cluster protein [Prochlorococcus sp. MIT 1300]